jgi:hypothetical protein
MFLTNFHRRDTEKTERNLSKYQRHLRLCGETGTPIDKGNTILAKITESKTAPGLARSSCFEIGGDGVSEAV